MLRGQVGDPAREAECQGDRAQRPSPTDSPPRGSAKHRKHIGSRYRVLGSYSTEITLTFLRKENVVSLGGCPLEQMALRFRGPTASVETVWYWLLLKRTAG